MYTSFDSAKMATTLAQIDLDEMSHCLARAI